MNYGKTISIAISFAACLYAGSVFAGGYGPDISVNSPSATATAVAVSSGGTGGVGGAGGAGGVGQGGSTGPVSQSQENKAYGIGAPGLAASANACQGSVSIAIVGFTYTIEFCRALQEAAVMSAMGFSSESIKNRLCQVDTVANTASECVGRKIQK